MNNFYEKYYSEFEGEPEIILSIEEKNGYKREFGIWGGYFDTIMLQVKPKEEGWTSLAYYYHLNIGW